MGRVLQYVSHAAMKYGSKGIIAAASSKEKAEGIRDNYMNKPMTLYRSVEIIPVPYDRNVTDDEIFGL